MIRLSKIALLVITAGMFAWPMSADAGGITISKNNPYKSFNISGINYGSMQWEREHGSGKSSSTPRRGGGFRRR